MRRPLLIALAALALCAGRADARWLYIATQHTDDTFGKVTSQWRDEAAVRAVASEYNQQVDMIRSADVDSGWKEQAIRRGVWLFRGGALPNDTTRYAVVIHGAFLHGNYNGTGYRPDSLTSTNYYPKCPQIAMGIAKTYQAFSISNAASTYDSSGVYTLATYTADKDSSMNVYLCGKPWLTWKNAGWSAAYKRDASGGGDNRGWRPLLGCVSTTPISGSRLAAGNFDDPWNGQPAPTLPDTLACWALEFWANNGSCKPINGDAKPFIFTSVAMQSVSQMNLVPLLVALAHADSASGGKVFADSTRIPVKIAIHMDDGWRRAHLVDKTYTGGIDPTDSTTIIASIDSLVALNKVAPCPFTLGVELDTLMLAQTTAVKNLNYYFDREYAWWARAGAMVSFTPHCHAGLGGTSARAGTAMVANDLWGSSNSTLYVCYPCGGSVKAINCTAARGFAICDSVFGPSRVDHVGMPPTDDWSPQNITSTSSANLDSLWLALTLGGIKAVRTNPSCSNCNVSSNKTGAGYYVGRFDYVVRLASPAGLPDVRGVRGSVLPTSVYGNAGSSVAGPTSAGLARKALLGRFTGRYVYATPDVQSAAYDAKTYFFTCHVSELGSDQMGIATRPAYFQIKELACEFQAINTLAGRSLLRIVRPEQLLQ